MTQHPITLDSLDACSPMIGGDLDFPCHSELDDKKIGHFRLHYEKLSPYDFLNTMDWKLYSQYTEDKDQLAKLSKRTELLRLLLAFQKLFKEYEFVCDSFLPNYGSTRRVQSLPRHKVHHNDANKMNLDVTLSCDESVSTEKGGKIQRLINATSCFLKIRHKNDQNDLFDRLFRYRGNPLDVFTNQCIRRVVMHRISFDLLKPNGRLKAHWIHIPLSLELLLPRIQAKIDIIRESCPFMQDAMEIASELRFFNYNVKQCVSYLKETCHLRNIIDEFPPRQDASNVPQGIHLYPTPLTEATSHLRGDEVLEFPPPPPQSRHSISENTTQTGDEVDMLLEMREKATETDCLELAKHTSEANCVLAIRTFKDKQIIKLRELHKFRIELLNEVQMMLHCTFGSVMEIGHFMLLYVDNLSKIVPPAEDTGKIEVLNRQVITLKEKLLEEEKKRKNLFNLMQEQLGNIRVYCRCRQPANKEDSILKITGNNSLVMMMPPCEEFKFDKVFSSKTSQAELYEEFRPLVASFMDGYNVCFITYGGEASGKTYTLIGNEEKPSAHGLIHRSLETVLKEQKLRSRDWSYEIDASCMEIYNDTFSDFLSDSSTVQLYVDSGLEHMHDKLQKVDLQCLADVDALVKVCRLKRRVAKTALNPVSSRSHLIILIRLTGKSRIHGQNFISFLGLCDLAGFEDVVKAETQFDEVLSKEAGHINKSLTAFNRMFVLLQQMDPNMVSYRDSKLTHILKGFLTNSGKCCLIIMVREDKSSMGSTQSTLRFGRETRGVTLGKAKKQFHPE